MISSLRDVCFILTKTHYFSLKKQSMASLGKKNSVYERFYVRLNLIFNGIVASSMIPFVLLFLQNQKDAPQPLVVGETADILKWTCIAVSLGLLIFANWQGPRLIAQARKGDTILAKLPRYISQKMKHYAMIESAALFSLVGFYILKDQLFSFIYLGVLFVFSMHRPTFGRVAREIGETEQALEHFANEESAT